MTLQYNPPASELEALRELDRLGETELYGVNIQELLRIASLRQKALTQLQRAETTFRGVVGSEDEDKARQAFNELQVALNGLQQITYPGGEAFTLRWQVLAADIARAQILQDALEVWWWHHFTHCIATFHQCIIPPSDGQTFTRAEKALAQARDLVNRWPDSRGKKDARGSGSVPDSDTLVYRSSLLEPSKITVASESEDSFGSSPWYTKAQQVLKKMEEKLKEAKEGYRELYINEAVYWLERAEGYLPEGKNTGQYGAAVQPQPIQSDEDGQTGEQVTENQNLDPLSALTCLSRARILLARSRTIKQAYGFALGNEVIQADVSEQKELEKEHDSYSLNTLGSSVIAQPGGTNQTESKGKKLVSIKSEGTRILELQNHLEDLQIKAEQFLPKWLGRQRDVKFRQLQEGLKNLWDKDTQSEPNGNPEGFLQKDKEGREIVDQVRFFLHHSPDLVVEPWLHKLVLTRQDNLLRAQHLLLEIGTYYPEKESDQESWIYWAWNRIQAATQLDPDSPEIERLRKSLEEAYQNLEQEFSKNLAKAKGLLNNQINFASSMPQAENALEEACSALAKCRSIVEKQREQPPGWSQEIEEIDQRVEELQNWNEQAQELIKDWSESGASGAFQPGLISETGKFLNISHLPSGIKFEVQNALKRVDHSRFRQPSHAIQYAELLTLQQHGAEESYDLR